jgi:hypothetical protein
LNPTDAREEVVEVDAAVVGDGRVPAVEEHRHHAHPVALRERERGVEVACEPVGIALERVPREPPAHRIHVREAAPSARELDVDPLGVEDAPQLVAGRAVARLVVEALDLRPRDRASEQPHILGSTLHAHIGSILRRDH